MKSKKLGKGGRFKALSDSVARSEMKEGRSPEEAMKIGKATAAKEGMEKYGKKKMEKWSKKGKK